MAQPIDQLPVARLGSYLAAQIPGFGRLDKAEKSEGGQSNPTFCSPRAAAATSCAASRQARCCPRPMPWTASTG